MSHLPPAPEGFEWRMFHEAIFLKPTGWNERGKSAISSGIPFDVYAASPDEFSEDKAFEMGFTLQIMRKPEQPKEMDASRMVLGYLLPFLEAHPPKDALMLDQKEKGDQELTIFRYIDAPPGRKPIIVHKFIMANRKTDIVHAFTFESPQATWNEHWAKYGTPIFSKLSITSQMPP
jgi:hypothetical protein